MHATSPSPDVYERVAQILDGVCRAVAARMPRERVHFALMMLVWTRLRRVISRFTPAGVLAAQLRRQRRIRAAENLHCVLHRARPVVSDGKTRVRVPQGYAWLVQIVPEVAGFGSQLQHLLDDPEMVALLREASGVRRTLRPICWMLAAQPTEALLVGLTVKTPVAAAAAAVPVADPSPAGVGSPSALGRVDLREDLRELGGSRMGPRLTRA